VLSANINTSTVMTQHTFSLQKPRIREGNFASRKQISKHSLTQLIDDDKIRTAHVRCMRAEWSILYSRPPSSVGPAFALSLL